MCLDTVSKRKPKPEGFGWKAFIMRSDGHLGGHIFTTYRARPIDEWLQEGDYRSYGETPSSLAEKPDYPIGWHIFKKKKDAKLWAFYGGGVMNAACSVWRKVKYRKAHICGKQCGMACVVAKEIKILPEGK